MKRIFVRGLSRSGGTLMVTVLDAHPEIAMGYEIYQHLLEAEEGAPPTTEVMLEELRQAQRRLRSSKGSNPRLVTFIGRVLRGGTDAKSLLDLLETHVAAGRGLETFEDRMTFIEAIALDKARRENKPHWGAKIASVYDDLHAMYPDAYFLFMLRDGRDIAASRKLTGNFKDTPEQTARAWHRQIERFEAFAARPDTNARMVRYEALAADPEPELRAIIDFLGLPWSDRVATFHQQDLSLYRNPTGHLSADQVNKPISTSSIGRWKQDLTKDEVDAFMNVAGDCLERLYGTTTSSTT